ncbi:hypothetical protein CAP48_05555 [Advenella sp. S44]|uniref:hypothetical protein n=1 Tax=Advenella sp. S44 TaxID=1982755 RepID=UPI000C29B76F|nr:hypothetical protein [Advenella sp. S44]PJX25511.1 hypothetical protein CAP48_05555 [Advenella sp. S44]
MKPALVFVRSFVPDFDGKLKKYMSVLDQAGVSYHFVGWARADISSEQGARFSYFKRRAPLGNGLKNIFNLLLWNIYLFQWLFSKRKYVNCIHVVDFDSVIPCFLFSRLFRRPLIFDIYDKYTSMRNMPGLLARAIDKLENYCIKRADLSILADRCRYEQHGLSPDAKNVIVLENVPIAAIEKMLLPAPEAKRLNIGYFGVLEPVHRGLEDLLELAHQCPETGLHIVGYGPLEAFIANKAGMSANIHFYGARSSLEGLAIMGRMDVMAGLYYRSVPNHLYAAPNKYYEHLMLGVPLVTTDGTPPGNKVEQFNTGWAISEGLQPLIEWVCSLQHEDVKKKSRAATQLWVANYANYYETHYQGVYARVITELMDRG